MNSVKETIISLGILGLICYIAYWGFQLFRGA